MKEKEGSREDLVGQLKGQLDCSERDRRQAEGLLARLEQELETSKATVE